MKNGKQFKDLPDNLKQTILRKQPAIEPDTIISYDEMLQFRLDAIQQALNDDLEKSETIDRKIVESIQQQEFISNQPSGSSHKLTVGQKVADGIARFGGSWTFIISFFLILIGWIGLNSVVLLSGAFDPYPFILLNLVLSCLAAIQAPIIMMSQNRQEERDREQSWNDYKINLKSEVEIRLLHEKVNHIIQDQMKHLIEIQNIQITLLHELQEEISESKKSAKTS